MAPPNDHNAEAKARLEKGDYDGAIALCTEAIRLDRNAAWAFLCRGVAQDFKAGHFFFGDPFTMAFVRKMVAPGLKTPPNLAIADFTEAIRIDSKNVIAYCNRGNDYLAIGKHEQAVADYSEAIRLDPTNPLRYIARANAYLPLDWERAIADFDEAIRLDPHEPNHRVSRVNAFGNKGRWKEVIGELTEVIRDDPTNALSYSLRATAHNGMGRFDRSIPDADEAIRLDPSLFLGFSARGYGHLQRGNPQPGGRTSTGCLAFLMTLGAGAVPAFLVGALAAHMIGNPDLVPMLPIVLAVLGGLASWFFLGFRPALAAQKRDILQSIADFTRALALRPNDVGSYMGRAMAYRAAGDADHAASDELKMRTVRWGER